MDRIQLDGSVLSEFARVASACGSDGFYGALLDAVGQIVTWDTCGIIQFSKYSIPQYILTRSVPPQEEEFYLSGFYRLDPFFRYWSKTCEPGVLSLQRMAGTVAAHDYKTSFQPRTGMMDEIGVICPKYQGVADDLFFLRKTPYGAEELDRLDAAFPLIRQLHALNIRLSMETLPSLAPIPEAAAGAECFAVLDKAGKTVLSSSRWDSIVANDLSLSDAVSSLSAQKHPATMQYSRGYVTSHHFDDAFALSPGGRLILVFPGANPGSPIGWDELLGSLHSDLLTARESDICRLILQGHPTAGIAAVLGISPGTVKNHRKRMYRKLDITSERELFLAALSMMSRHTL